MWAGFSFGFGFFLTLALPRPGLLSVYWVISFLVQRIYSDAVPHFLKANPVLNF